MRRIIFVDDEPKILKAMARRFRSMRDQWEMAFFGDSEAVLAVLEQSEFDVIVSDYRMPRMDGLRLLERIKADYPGMLRVLLSGNSDQGGNMKSVAHFCLSKPCDRDKLAEVINQAGTHLPGDDGACL